MNLEFLIPVSRDDLLRKTSVNQYTVEEVLSRSRIPAAVQGKTTNAAGKILALHCFLINIKSYLIINLLKLKEGFFLRKSPMDR